MIQGMPPQRASRSSRVRRFLKLQALAPLSIAGVLALWGCAPSGEESASPSSSSGAVETEASLEGLPLADLIQFRGYQFFEVMNNSPLYDRLQRLLGPSLPRLQKNGYRLNAEGATLTALPTVQELDRCDASVFWADVRADRIQVWVPIGKELRSFSEGESATPPPEVEEAVEAIRSHVAQCPGPDYPAAPWTTEGKCASTFGISSNKVYLFGSMRHGRAGPAALLDPSQSGRYMTGFPEESISLLMKPSGELVYSDGEKLRVFVPDPQARDLPSSRDRRPVGEAGCYSPENPEANDIEIRTEGCESSGGLGRFWVRAGDGAVIYNCQYDRDERRFFVAGGESFSLPAQSEQPLAFGYSSTVLYPGGFGLKLGDTRGSNAPDEIEIDPNVRPEGPVRAVEDGYLIALLGAGAEQPPSLWKISLNGQIVRVADYPSPPPGLSFVSGSWRRSRLAADGTLWVTSYGGEVYAVVAFAPGGASWVAYRIESFPEPPIVALDSLVTAP